MIEIPNGGFARQRAAEASLSETTAVARRHLAAVRATLFALAAEQELMQLLALHSIRISRRLTGIDIDQSTPLDFVVLRGIVRRLLSLADVVNWLARHWPEHLCVLQEIALVEVLQGAARYPQRQRYPR